MKHFFFLIALTIVINGCETKVATPIKHGYLKIADSLNAKYVLYLDSIRCFEYYENSKWKIYLKYCDKKMVVRDNFKDSNSIKYFGSLPIYLTYANVDSNSLLHLSFVPIIFDSLLVDYRNFEDSTLKFTFNQYLYYDTLNHSFYGYGVGIGINKDSTELNDYCNGIPDCNKRSFIESNRKTLDNWFVNEAVKRNFISERR